MRNSCNHNKSTKSTRKYFVKRVPRKNATALNKCIVCGKLFSANKAKYFCSMNCYKEFRRYNTTDATNNYERAHGEHYSFLHRRIAENLLGPLGDNIVVHHIDGNVMRNVPENLLILSRRDHRRLHGFLDLQRWGMTHHLHKSEEEWVAVMPERTCKWLENFQIVHIRLDQIDDSTHEILEKMRNIT